jgi:hypothetical protein
MAEEGRNLLVNEPVSDKSVGKNLLPSEETPQTVKEKVKDYAGTAVSAGVAGALTPELLQYGGMGVSAVGFPEIGVPMMYTGEGLKGARLATAAESALGGVVGKGAGDVATKLNVAPPGVMAIEFIGAGLGSQSYDLAKLGFQKLVQSVTGAASATDVNKAINAFAETINPETKTLTQKQLEFVKDKINQIRGGARNVGAAEKSYQTIKSGVEQEQEAARLQAQNLRSKAQLEAPAKQNALNAAERERLSLGEKKDTNTIGTELRDKITAKQKAAIKARQEAFDRDEKVVQSQVHAKEGQGLYVSNDPASEATYNSIIKTLEDRLLIGKVAQSNAKTAPTTDPKTISQLQTIYDSIKGRSVSQGIDEFGNPNMKKFPASFEALDEIRRKLGDAAFGKISEGYDAIGQSNARTLYIKLSELLGEYAPAKQQLIKNYEANSEEVNLFKTVLGKKATAVEKFDADRFKYDPSSLPNSYFNTPKSVKDLIELTGDKALVEKLGGSYITQQLEGKSAAQVETIIRNNTWLSEFPNIANKVRAYQTNLLKAESMLAAEKVIATAETEAGKIEQAAEAKAKEILGSSNPVPRMADMITSKSSVLLQPKVAEYIINAPGGRENFTKAVGTVLGDASPQTIKKVFTDNVKPALQASKIVSPEEITRLEKLVNDIDRTVNEKQKINQIVRVVTQALAGTAAANYPNFLGGRSIINAIPGPF